jgi:hypothetical protein
VKRVSISFELSGDSFERRYYSLAFWLNHHDAVQVMGTQWVLVTPLTVEEIKYELQTLTDPADRLLVTQVGPMSFRNLIVVLPASHDVSLAVADVLIQGKLIKILVDHT